MSPAAPSRSKFSIVKFVSMAWHPSYIGPSIHSFSWWWWRAKSKRHWIPLLGNKAKLPGQSYPEIPQKWGQISTILEVKRGYIPGGVLTPESPYDFMMRFQRDISSPKFLMASDLDSIREIFPRSGGLSVIMWSQKKESAKCVADFGTLRVSVTCCILVATVRLSVLFQGGSISCSKTSSTTPIARDIEEFLT